MQDSLVDQPQAEGRLISKLQFSICLSTYLSWLFLVLNNLMMIVVVSW